jgi:hypothetical protein
VSIDVFAEATPLDGHRVREAPLGSSRARAWPVVLPDDLPDLPVRSLGDARRTDRPGAPRQERFGPDQGGPPVSRLIRAVANADAASFAATAAALTGASVTMVDRHGAVIASSAGPAPKANQPGGPGRDIVLRDDTGLHGAIRLASSFSAPELTLELLGGLGLALVKAIDAERRRSTLESQLVILGCLAGRDAEHLFRRDLGVPRQTPRRLVVIGAPRPIDGHAGIQLRDLITRAAARTLELADLCLVLSDGWLLGVYPDIGGPLSGQRKSWAAVLGAAEAGWMHAKDCWALTAAVGALVSDIEDFRLQYRLARDLAKLQRNGSRYFDLPSVAVLDDLGPLAEVLGATPGRELVPFVERVLGDLLDDQRFGGQLIETLHAFLQTSGSPREAGVLLHLHPSTVKYRIRVVRELLGPRLEDQSCRFDLELAVRLCLAARQLRKRRAR